MRQIAVVSPHILGSTGLMMEMADSKIALVVCTRNRAKRLDSFFESLRGLKCDEPWDLVIVDNGSTDDTNGRLKMFASTFPGRVTLVTEPQAGLGRARNRGWRASQAPIIAFTDDDCYPEANFLNDVLRVFTNHSLGFAGGRILLYDSSDVRMTINETLTEQIYNPEDFVIAGAIQGANMAFRREALVDIEGFDDSIGPGTPFTFDDVDAVIRVLAAGWKGKHNPHSVVYHHHGRKPGTDLEAINRVYDAGRGAYYIKCILFMPQRWRCLRYWLGTVRRQPFAQARREALSAIRYFFYQFKKKPNITYK